MFVMFLKWYIIMFAVVEYHNVCNVCNALQWNNVLYIHNGVMYVDNETS